MTDARSSSPIELPYDAHAHLRTDGVRFLEIVTDHGFEHPVPSCPGWNLADLAWHLGGVWNFWSRIVAEGVTSGDTIANWARPTRPSDDDLLLDWVTAAHTALYSALTRTSDGAEVWTWTGSNQPEVWVERRMTQETAVHRWDAANAVGLPYDIPTAVAADGIDEFLMWFAGNRLPDAEPVGGSVHLHCTDTAADIPEGSDDRSLATGEWLVKRLDESGIEFTREHAKGDAAIRGTANDLLLWLWRRDGGPVEILGDTSVAARFRAFPAL